VVELSLTFFLQQHYNSSNPGEKSFTGITFNCLYRNKCGCYVAFCVKRYKDKVSLLQAGEHTPDSHIAGKGILFVKQCGTIKRTVRAAPMAVGSQVHANLQNFSPGRRVPYDARSRAAVSHLTRRERAAVLEETVPCITLDGSEGSMNELADSLSLEKLLARHNDPNDSFHMDEHQVVCVGQINSVTVSGSLHSPHRVCSTIWRVQRTVNGRRRDTPMVLSIGAGKKLH
jgi:hypothetical protein